MGTVLLALLKRYWLEIGMLVAGVAIGGYCAWGIQGWRLDRVKNEFEHYKFEVQEAAISAERAATKQRDDAAREYALLQRKLKNEIDSGEVWKRCVAAGKCGYFGGVSNRTASGAAVAPTGRVDGASTHAVPLAGGPTTEFRIPSVVNECAETTLILNRLQTYIEAQPGYGEF